MLGTFAIGAPILASREREAGPTAGISHQFLESDRQMTQQMGVVIGPSMDAQMGSVGMLQRSADPSYVRALEEHTYQFDWMLGRAP